MERAGGSRGETRCDARTRPALRSSTTVAATCGRAPALAVAAWRNGSSTAPAHVNGEFWRRSALRLWKSWAARSKKSATTIALSQQKLRKRNEPRPTAVVCLNGGHEDPPLACGGFCTALLDIR